MVGDIDNIKSTTRYVYNLGSTVASWVSKLQKIVALSTIETVYIVMTEVEKEMMWLHFFLEELGHKYDQSVLHCDNHSAMHLEKNPFIMPRQSTYRFDITS